MHYGTDFVASKGTNVYSLMDGKVESIDTSNHTVVIITEKDRNIWYENDTARTFKLTYGNITLKSGLKKTAKLNLVNISVKLMTTSIVTVMILKLIKIICTSVCK